MSNINVINVAGEHAAFKDIQQKRQSFLTENLNHIRQKQTSESRYQNAMFVRRARAAGGRGWGVGGGVRKWTDVPTK